MRIGKSKSKLLIGTVGLGLTLSSCGGGERQFLDNFEYDLGEARISTMAEFSQDISLDLEVQAALGEFGTVNFIPNQSGAGFKVAIEFDLSGYVDEALALLPVATALPNGTRFHSFIETDLYTWKVYENSSTVASVYLGLEEGFYYLGAGAQLDFIDGDFPEGVTLSQRIYSGDAVIGVVSFYGPKTDSAGNTLEPGGFFVATNVSALDILPGFAAQSKAVTMDQDIIVNGPEASKYDNDRALYGIFKKFKSKSAKADLSK